MFGAGSRRAELMLAYFKSPERLYEASCSDSRTQGMLTEQERVRLKETMGLAEKVKARTLKKGCAILTPDQPDYPPLLQEIYAKPAVLYVKGDVACLQNSLCIAVVGPRKPTVYGEKVTEQLAGDLASSGAVIVSGLAKGIDSIAHKAALQAGGKTVGFLGCGMDVDYPSGSSALKRAVCENGAVVTEFPLGTEPVPYNFPIRNRLVSGVSHGVLVTEASAQSGALLTAAHALEQGKDVYAVPGPITSPSHKGANRLIRDGAGLVESAADILICYPQFINPMQIQYTIEEGGPERLPPVPVKKEKPPVLDSKQKPLPKKAPPEELSEAAAGLYAKINTPCHVNDLAATAGMDVGEVLSALTELEIYGLVQMYPGSLFGPGE